MGMFIGYVGRTDLVSEEKQQFISQVTSRFSVQPFKTKLCYKLSFPVLCSWQEPKPLLADSEESHLWSYTAQSSTAVYFLLFWEENF